MKLEGIAIDDVIDYMEEHKKYVTLKQRERLKDILSLPETIVLDVAAPVDILDEVKEQLKLVRQIRLGLAENGYQPKELKDLVATSNTLFATLTKYNNDIENQEKVKRIESATLEALKLLTDEAREVYFEALAKHLEK